ncbi:MAG: maleate isomerase [Paracoccaceae bacterium]|jgi:maleate isomerase
MTALPYTLTGPIGTRASLGLIVLQADEVIEQDFRRLFPDRDVAVYASRIPSGADLTPETLKAMETALPRAAELLPPSVGFDAIGYACTSGATVIGPQQVEDMIHRAADARAVTDPLTAAAAALAHLGVRNIGLISPYIEDVSAALRAALTARGFAIARFGSFEEQQEARVARIDPASIRDAAIAVGRHNDVDAVFLSCTNLRTLDVIDAVEAAIGKPVVSSNLALAWHMGRLADVPATGPGRLLAR